MSGNHAKKPTESANGLLTNAPAEELHRRQAEFTDLEQRHGMAVWAIAYARCKDKHEAHDIKQETFLRLWREWGRGVAILNPKAWLLRVAGNLAKDCATRAFHINGTQSPETMSGVQSCELMPPEQLDREETIEAVKQELVALPAIDGEIIRLQVEMGLTYEEIAKECGLTAKAVKGRLARCRPWLRIRLKHLDPSS